MLTYIRQGSILNADTQLTENKYDLGRLKTHRFHLEEAERAILTLGGEIGGEEAICVSLHPDAA